MLMDLEESVSRQYGMTGRPRLLLASLPPLTQQYKELLAFRKELMGMSKGDVRMERYKNFTAMIGACGGSTLLVGLNGVVETVPVISTIDNAEIAGFDESEKHRPNFIGGGILGTIGSIYDVLSGNHDDNHNNYLATRKIASNVYSDASPCMQFKSKWQLAATELDVRAAKEEAGDDPKFGNRGVKILADDRGASKLSIEKTDAGVAN
jgi:hypothetical protein